MQTDSSKLFQLTAEKLNVGIDDPKHQTSPDLVKAIGDHILKSIKSEMKNPKALILKIKGMGSFYLRKMRVELFVEHHEYLETGELPPNLAHLTEDDLKNVRRQNEAFKARLKDYEEYLSEKAKNRKLREYVAKIYAEQASQKSSEDHDEKHPSGSPGVNSPSPEEINQFDWRSVIAQMGADHLEETGGSEETT